MKDEIIKGLYKQYLQEVLIKDEANPSELTYIVRLDSNKYIVSKKGENEEYEEVGIHRDGFRLVKTEKGYNFLDDEGNFLSDEWFEGASDFYNGFAKVTKKMPDNSRKSNFIDKNGNYVLKEWLPFNRYSSYVDGDVIVLELKTDRMDLLDKNGRRLSSFEHIHRFYGSTALAVNYNKRRLESIHDKNYKEYSIITSTGDINYLGYKYKDIHQISESVFVASDDNHKSFLIDRFGNRIGNVEFDDCTFYGFRCGYLLIVKDQKYNLINPNGELLFKKWYEHLDIPYGGFTAVRENNKYNYLDMNENLLSDTWFDYAKPFEDNNAVVRLNNQDYLLDDKGNLSKSSYFEIYSSRNGYRVVMRDGRYNLISKDGETTSDTWFPYSYYEVQDNNLRLVENSEGLKNYVDIKGNPILKEWKENLTLISAGLFGSIEDDNIIVYDLNGNVVTKINGVENVNLQNQRFIAQVPKKRLKKLEYQKKWFHYEYESDNVTYSLDGIPLADYGDILIINNNSTAYVYDKTTKETYPLGKMSTVQLEANYIIVGEKKLFVSGRNLIDISDIKFESTIDLKQGIKSLKTFEEFREMCKTEKYEEIINNELEKAKQVLAENEKQRIAQDLERKKQEEAKLLEEKHKEINRTLSDLSELLSECSKYITEVQGKINDNAKDKVKVPEELLLIKVNDHYEINPLFITNGILKFIDLRYISFADVKVSNLDLSYTNAHINPQTVYNKDMSNSKFCGLDFNLCDFTGVNTENSDFTDAIMDFAMNKDSNTK